eukprot:TRINITY_DN4519_c0_g2_i1.p1 TRINITY_DN4519_c0_g2~~TRINITY_DN4519_c0_g2_i1.p1  ORF type:complete len:616 (+),score=150.52 TRINITY_DN4519_c0_g2_i1:101-1948(+)
MANVPVEDRGPKASMASRVLSSSLTYASVFHSNKPRITPEVGGGKPPKQGERVLGPETYDLHYPTDIAVTLQKETGTHHGGFLTTSQRFRPETSLTSSLDYSQPIGPEFPPPNTRFNLHGMTTVKEPSRPSSSFRSPERVRTAGETTADERPISYWQHETDRRRFWKESNRYAGRFLPTQRFTDQMKEGLVPSMYAVHHYPGTAPSTCGPDRFYDFDRCLIDKYRPLTTSQSLRSNSSKSYSVWRSRQLREEKEKKEKKEKEGKEGKEAAPDTTDTKARAPRRQHVSVREWLSGGGNHGGLPVHMVGVPPLNLSFQRLGSLSRLAGSGSQATSGSSSGHANPDDSSLPFLKLNNTPTWRSLAFGGPDPSPTNAASSSASPTNQSTATAPPDDSKSVSGVSLHTSHSQKFRTASMVPATDPTQNSAQQKPTVTALLLHNNELEDTFGFVAGVSTRVASLQHLRWIDLSFNRISQLDVAMFEECVNLSILNLHSNAIADLQQLNPHLSHLTHLRTLTLFDNPIQQLPQYRILILALCPSLHKLDHQVYSPVERQKAVDYWHKYQKWLPAENGERLLQALVQRVSDPNLNTSQLIPAAKRLNTAPASSSNSNSNSRTM